MYKPIIQAQALGTSITPPPASHKELPGEGCSWQKEQQGQSKEVCELAWAGGASRDRPYP